ncbi:MAG: O-antigen ligase family protein [Thermomicrobia bacterium]|nr:O-antigen ligase family protein [Thermomicrobia bacterium]MCA1723602.1 O-antigen ligase family protein [Thermomicrobia bacterium]
MSRALRLASGAYRDPLLWPLGAAVLLLFLVPSTLAALLPLAIVGLIGLRRPTLVVMVIPVTFPFHDVTSPAAHLHLDRTALLIGVALLATFGHVVLAALPAYLPAIGKLSAVVVEETWTRAEIRAFPADVLAFFWQPGTWAALSLFALGLFSLFTVADAEFRGNSIREFRMTILFPVALFLLAAALFEGSAPRRMMLPLLLLGVDAVIVSGVIVSLIAFLQFAHGGGLDVEGVRRVRSVFHHPNELALYLGRIVPITAAYVFFMPRTWRTWAYLAATVIMLGGIGLSFSRGGYISVAAALLLLICATGNRRLVVGYSAAVAVVGVAAFATGIERFTSILHPTSGSDGLRLNIWASAARMLRDHPAWGVGLDQFISQYPRYLSPDAWQERFTSHPHNLILDFYVRLGLLGLAWLIFTVVPFLVRGWRVAMRRKAEGDLLRFAVVIGATGALVDFTVHGMVDQDYFLHMLAYGFWFAILIIRVGAADWPMDEPGLPDGPRLARAPLPRPTTDPAMPTRATARATTPLAGGRHPV